MSTLGRRGTLAPLLTDGISMETLSKTGGPALSQVDESHRYWASGQRGVVSTHREIMEVSFGSERLVNRLAFRASRFPLVLSAEYLDGEGHWVPFTYKRPRYGHDPRRPLSRPALHLQPVRLSISESIPAKVDSARAAGNPKHFGKNHWLAEDWDLTPVKTRKIRLVVVRNHHGRPPRNPHGREVPYSVAVKDLRIGYKVVAKPDLPPVPPDDPWASSRDILGSQTVFSTYTQPAEKVIDGDSRTFWRSEPQPFPFAVVNMHLDVRQPDGSSPVIDRFWVDPVTTGVMCNLYYCDTVPDGDFIGSSTAIPSQFVTETGGPGLIRDGATNAITAVDLGPGAKAGVAISNDYLRMRYDQPWWVGIDGRSLADATDPHPLVTLGNTQILIDGADLKVLSQSGAEATVSMDGYGEGTMYRLVASYHPYDPASGRDAHFRIAFKMGSFDPVVVEAATTPLDDPNAPVKIGLHPDPDDTTLPALGVFGLVVKSETLTDDVETWFLDEGAGYVADPESAYLDRGTAQNARVRMHPSFVTGANAFGVVGGTGDRFGDMEWTPVPRDYVLKQGYLHVPPTKAAFWKFEMTGLIAEVYENFLPVDREVLVFPPDVVAEHQQVAGEADNSSVPSGVQTTANAIQQVAYADALNTVRAASANPDATKVLVVTDPTLAEQAAQTGWVWTYRPWHVGSSAPQFMGTRQHVYEMLRVRTTTKVSFFAGIREIQPFRTDYGFNDDTPEIVEHFLDAMHLDLTASSSIELVGSGGVQSLSATSKVVSSTLASYRLVRGVQFASQEPSEVQVLADPDFAAPDLRLWSDYGDATLVRLGEGDVVVNRGWFGYSYHDLETLPQFSTYGNMEGTPYGQLEGNNTSTGSAEGGITSETHIPSGAGKVLAVVRVSADGPMSGPVLVEIVEAFDDRVVGSASRFLVEGETADVRVAHTPGTVVNRRTYGDIEQLEGSGAITTRTNLVTNPHPSGGFVGWDFLPAPTEIADIAGEPFWSVDGPGASMVIQTTADPGEVYTFSVKVWNTLLTMKVEWYDDIGTLLGDDESSVIGSGATARIHQTFPASPPGTTNGFFSLNSDDNLVVTEAMIEQSSTMGDFFYGETPDGGGLDHEWVGTPYHSFSTETTTVTTYGSLEKYRYYQLESTTEQASGLYVRVRQQGPSDDTFHVHRVAFYDSPIAWYFSNDDGATWWQAIDVRNDPHGVLIFPPSDTPEEPGVGRSLRWRADIYRADAVISSLFIRPWYGTRSHSVPRSHGLEQIGPNKGVYDDFPATHQHPAWVQTFNPVEHLYSPPPVVAQVWRNLVLNPSGEGGLDDDQWAFRWGGEIEPQFVWERGDGTPVSLYGSRVWRFETNGIGVMVETENLLGLAGPPTYKGAFPVLWGPEGRKVSFLGSFGCSERTVWVQPSIKWGVEVDGEVVEVEGEEEKVDTILRFGGVDDFNLYSLQYSMEVPSNRDFWWPVFRFFSTDPNAEPGVVGEPVPDLTSIMIEGLYVPEYGQSTVGQPYLDGDQPGTIWEGPPNNSTSLWVGVENKPPPDPATLWLDDDLPV